MKTLLIVLFFIFILGIAGRMDYEDAIRVQERSWHSYE